MLQFSLSVGFVLMQVYLSVGFVLLQLSLSVYLIEIFPVCCSYHNGDHYNSVRRSGDLNSRTPPSIRLASLVVVPQQQRVAAANSYRSNSSSGGGYREFTAARNRLITEESLILLKPEID